MGRRRARFILDTLVASQARHAGVGTRLVAIAAEHARAAGCERLHVDFGDELAGFYFGACGFSRTNAGLIALRIMFTHPPVPAAGRRGRGEVFFRSVWEVAATDYDEAQRLGRRRPPGPAGGAAV